MSDDIWTVEAPFGGVRLDKFLADPARLGSRSRANEAIARGKVFLNGTEVEPREGAVRVKAGDRVRVWTDRPGSAARRSRPRIDDDLRIVYEDDVLLVVDKPPNLLTVPLSGSKAPSLADAVAEYLRPRGKRRPHVVHRIDRDTSGLVVFAKTAAAQEALEAQFERRQPERVYLALVHGVPNPSAGTWRDWLVWDPNARVQRVADRRHARAREAISDYRLVERLGPVSLVEVRLVTGKRNQIRVQAHRHGVPLVGERMYIDVPDGRALKFPRQALHASRLSFEHPAHGRPVAVEAPLPADLAELIAALRRRA